MLIRVLRDRYVRSWPSEKWVPEGPPHVEDVPIISALTREWPTDAHFVGYVGGPPRRLNAGALASGPVDMRWLILEVDYPKEKREEGRAPDEWWRAEVEKISHLRADEPGVLAYRTRGGYRLLGSIGSIPIACAEDARQWSELVILLGAHLDDKYKINIDPYCRDWQHLQRAPGALRAVGDSMVQEPRELIFPDVAPSWLLSGLDFEHARRRALELGEEREDWGKAIKCLDPKSVQQLEVPTLPATLAGDVDLDLVVAALASKVGLIGVGGGRHRLYMHLAGVLLSRGLPPDALVPVIEAVSIEAGVDDPSETRDRVAAARTTLTKHAAGEAFTQIGELQALHPDVARAIDTFMPSREARQGKKLVLALRQEKERNEDPRPVVRVTADEHLVIDDVVAAMEGHPILYQRGNHLAEVMHSGDGSDDLVIRQKGAPYIREVPGPRLRDVMTSTVRLEKFDKRERDWIQAHPPDWLVAGVGARGTWPGLHPLVGVADSPVFLGDGRVPTVPGYDERSGLWVSNGVHVEVSNKPTLDDAVDAAAQVLELVEEFSFVGDAHRAGWLCALLTVLSRFAFEGCVPLVFVEASTAGSGKSLLVDVISTLAFGRPANRSSYSADDEEMRKKITTAVRGGDRMVLFDNVENGGMFKSASLDRVLTGTTWEDRLLGTNDSFKAPVYTTWFVSGNNLGIGGDIGRRIMHVRLVPDVEQPDRVTGFKIPRLLAHARQHRDRLLSCALTILRAFHEAGRPDMGLGAWGSFEEWSALPRAATVWCGLDDPGEARAALTAQADTAKQAAGELASEVEKLIASKGGRPVTAKEVLNASADVMRGGRLRDALEELGNVRNGGKLSPRTVSWILRKIRGRVFGGKAVDCVEDTKLGLVWCLKRRSD